jgi:transcriptional regulator with XRE-family HTH domain
MESMALAHINPAMVTWARTNANLTPEQLSRDFVDLEQLTAWETGEQPPTFTQLETLAKKCRIPVLAFFLSQPPTAPLPLTDLRTIRDAQRKKLSANFSE